MEVYLLKGYIWRSGGIRSDKKFEIYCRKDAFKIVPINGKITQDDTVPPKITESSNCTGENKKEFLETFKLGEDTPMKLTPIGENRYNAAFANGFGVLDLNRMTISDHYLLCRRSGDNTIIKADSNFAQCVAVAQYERLTVVFKLNSAQIFYLDGEEIKKSKSSPPVVLGNQPAPRRHPQMWRPHRNMRFGDFNEISLDSSEAVFPTQFRILKDKVIYLDNTKRLTLLNLKEIQLALITREPETQFTPSYKSLGQKVAAFDVGDKGEIVFINQDTVIFNLQSNTKRGMYEDKKHKGLTPNIIRMMNGKTFAMSSHGNHQVLISVVDKNLQLIDQLHYQLYEPSRMPGHSYSYTSQRFVELFLYQKRNMIHGLFLNGYGSLGVMVWRKNMVSIVGRVHKMDFSNVYGMAVHKKSNKVVVHGKGSFSYARVLLF